MEFLTTTRFKKRDDIHDMGNLTFCLVGERRECSLAELAWRLDLYDQYEGMTKGFSIFVDHYHKFFLDGISDANWWNTIANGCIFHEPLNRVTFGHISIDLSTASLPSPSTKERKGIKFRALMCFSYGASLHLASFSISHIMWLSY